ncbi:ELM1/GtrOC1 family putative glycosyltransferase [Marinobacter sp. F3R08]|uniref:ELM1/GtrOC1 family putative glycosyltransferase n=1 Tax=Marinobacter sp. F3R08 TaxID=2841559 RepID=UPI001C083144|nr:ELM1/GtrOC1 family putative glycosyltransferase [Marinobacter sp. F3R08]MBU2952416.1 mitochondrial fission ELM1 family protein [Marinobacter sp. F3R08]
MVKPELRTQDASTPVVWLLTDNKPGHRNQLKGLGNRLRVLAGASTYWVDATAMKVPLWRALLASPPKMEASLPRPDLVIAAGSGTHRLLLALRKLRGLRTLVIMKPAFPLSLISGALIPAHDRVQPGPKILFTEGVLNTITPLARITDKREALLLIGGPSPHVDWDDDVVLGQISHLIGHYPDWRWTISTSRRTPESIHERLDEMAGLRITVVHPERTHEDWLSHQLSASRAAWVTPDSMSMVSEAATSGVPTGLFKLPTRPGSRVADGVDRLIRDGYVAQWTDHASVMAGRTNHDRSLWEANRAARWILDNGLLPTSRKTNQRLHKGIKP